MSLANKHEDSGMPSKETFFQGKHVVITGGASGIGLALAEQLFKLGADVSVIDISFTKNLPEKIAFTQADVTNKSVLEAKVQAKKVDLLIIAAGVTSQTNEPTEQEQNLMEAVNVRGVQNSLDVFESRLIPRAQVVYIGSDDPPKAYYADTKRRGAEAVRAFAHTHSGLDVRIILLGPVRTPLFNKGKPPEVIQRIAEHVGLYEPQEFADALIGQLVKPSQDKNSPQEMVMYKKVK